MPWTHIALVLTKENSPVFSVQPTVELALIQEYPGEEYPTNGSSAWTRSRLLRNPTSLDNWNLLRWYEAQPKAGPTARCVEGGARLDARKGGCVFGRSEVWCS